MREVMGLSNYTIEWGIAIESGFPVLLDNYPIFDESYREKLNEKIVMHYYYHEIGFETIDKFNHYMAVRLNEVMPYFNQLYQSELLSINPLLSFSRTTASSKDTETTATENGVMNQTASGTIGETGSVIATGTAADQSSIDNTAILSSSDSQDSSVNSSQINRGESTKATNSSITDKNRIIESDTPQSLLTDPDTSVNIYATKLTDVSNSNQSGLNESIDNVDNVDSSTITSNETKSDSTTTNTTTAESSSNTSNNTNTTNNTTSTDQMNNDTSKVSEAAQKEITTITENGHEVPLSDLLIRYRETFLNVDLQVIEAVADLFMMVY